MDFTALPKREERGCNTALKTYSSLLLSLWLLTTRSRFLRK